MTDVDIRYEVHFDGEWRPALCTASHDAHNKAFVYFTGDGVHFTTDIAEWIPEGTGDGKFRRR